MKTGPREALMSENTHDGRGAGARRRYWRGEDARIAVEAWKRSGQSLVEFSRRHGIHPRRIRRWAQRLESEPESEFAEPVRFHPVQLVTTGGIAQQGGAPIEIVLGEKLLVRVPSGFAAADLTRVLQVLAMEAGC
jgi:transposase-like protein